MRISIFSTSMRGGFSRLAAAIALSMGLAALSALALSSDPGSTILALFRGPFATPRSLLSMLERAAPLALCAVGALLAFRAGQFTLGGEGQVYAGAVCAAMAALRAPSGGGGLALAFAAAALGGGLVAAPPALGKRFLDADVLLPSMLVSQGAIFTIDWAIAGPLRDSTGNLIAMRPIPAASLLPRVAPPSTLTAMPFAALLVCACAAFFLGRTRKGLELDAYGANPVFACLRGYSTRALSWAPVVASGMLHGIAGAALTLGANGTAVKGMSGGLGWNAIGVALIAGKNPLAVPFAALLFSWLDAGARQASLLSDLPPDSAQVIKALVLITVSARPAWSLVRAARSRRAERSAVRRGEAS